MSEPTVQICLLDCICASLHLAPLRRQESKQWTLAERYLLTPEPYRNEAILPHRKTDGPGEVNAHVVAASPGVQRRERKRERKRMLAARWHSNLELIQNVAQTLTCCGEHTFACTSTKAWSAWQCCRRFGGKCESEHRNNPFTLDPWDKVMHVYLAPRRLGFLFACTWNRSTGARCRPERFDIVLR